MENTIAIIGASPDRTKYGNKAVRAFIEGGWTVYPVNSKAETIEGLKVYASIEEVPQPLRRISMYVPPSVGKGLLEAIAATAHDELFFNPGSDEEGIIEAAEALGLKPTQACSIVNIGMRPDMFPDD